MRDIRNDLQERADLIHDRIKAAAVHFERMVEQLRNEHDARVADLKACLAMIAKLMEFEERHIANMSPETTRRRRLPNMLISRKNLEGWCSGGCFNQRQAVRVRLGSADRSRRPLCCFADAEVLKGRWASALLGSFTVGQKTGDNFMLV